jgi:hypothetical protein
VARRSEARVHWRHLVVYGAAALIAAVIGVLAIWEFIERQSLVIAADPLPKVTVVTLRPDSPLAAGWVKILTDAEMQPTLVPLEKFDSIEGVVLFCDIPDLPRGGTIAFKGPRAAIGKLHLTADAGLCDTIMRLSEAVSPVLARLNPGYEIGSRRVPVALLRESPRMVVDARWKDNARAAIMHMENGGARFLWCGFDPNALNQRDDRQLMLLLRTAFRWVAGQPVSDGAVGPQALAAVLAPEARREARAERFTFSVDRTSRQRLLTVRMINRGNVPLQNPTVKIWLPPGITDVALAHDFLAKRDAIVNDVPEEGACLVSLPSLTRNEDRLMKLSVR